MSAEKEANGRIGDEDREVDGSQAMWDLSG